MPSPETKGQHRFNFHHDLSFLAQIWQTALFMGWRGIFVNFVKKLALLLFPCLLIWLNSKCFTYLLYDDDDIMSFCVCCIILHLRYVLLIVSSRTIQSLASMPSSQTRQNWSQTKKMMWNYQENIQIFHQINISIDASWLQKKHKMLSCER